MTLDPWTAYKCTSCGFGLLDPRPTKAYLSELYRRDYFAEQYDEGVEPNSPEFKRWISLLDHRVRFFRHKKKKGTLLDIGCGNGYFMALCQEKGYQVQGVDISSWAAEYATQKLGFNVTVGEIEDISLPTHFFDIITMWHFLEHTRNPVDVVCKVKTWLKPDGILAVEVPNYEGTDAQRYWEDWIGWQFPYHLCHFTEKTQRRLLQKCGFRIIKKKNFHSEWVKISLKRIPVIRMFSRLIARFYSGTSVVMLAVRDD
jgi:2-polyprenyl-3-methyl-5-hydroxy-6-metoxy-1,4-benzoquinol methylase